MNIINTIAQNVPGTRIGWINRIIQIDKKNSISFICGLTTDSYFVRSKVVHQCQKLYGVPGFDKKTTMFRVDKTGVDRVF